MPDNKTAALGLFAAAAFGTVLCMPLSAAGQVRSTIIIAAVSLLFALFGFIFGALASHEIKVAEQSEIRASAQKDTTQAAIDALNEFEAAQKSGAAEDVLDEKNRNFTRCSMDVIWRMGEVSVSSKEVARVSVSKAIAAQKELAKYTSHNAPEEDLAKLQKQAETLSRIAVRDLRNMIAEQESSSAN